MIYQILNLHNINDLKVLSYIHKKISTMKKICIILSIAVVIITACQQTHKTVPVDIKAEEAAVNDLLNRMITAFKEQDVATLQSLLSEDMLGCGSDPSEFWNKQQVTEMWTQMLVQPFELDIIGDPKIKVAPDGHSAFAVHQYFMPFYSSKLAFRNGYHLIKSDGKWLIFSFNTACIPKNDDLPKISEAIK